MKIKMYRSAKMQAVDEREAQRIYCAPEPEDITDDERKDYLDGNPMLTVDFTDGSSMFVPPAFVISIEP